MQGSEVTTNNVLEDALGVERTGGSHESETGAADEPMHDGGRILATLG